MQERVQYTSWIEDVPLIPSYAGAGAFSFYGFRFFFCLETSRISGLNSPSVAVR